MASKPGAPPLYALARSDQSMSGMLMREALSAVPAPDGSGPLWSVVSSFAEVPEGSSLVLQWDEYEELKWDDGIPMLSGYICRNGPRSPGPARAPARPAGPHACPQPDRARPHARAHAHAQA